ncbi:MAG: hypothetical protein GXO23_03545 [Crenarchaeota archaeon]|nr:hypothetical protein [Thermoproteota archaeon]
MRGGKERPLLDPIHDCGLLGVVRSVYGMPDCAVIIHGRPGCHSGMLTLQGLTGPQTRMNIVYSGLKDEDLAIGGEDVLKRAILNTYKILRPELIIVASASAVGIMGDDVDGVIREVSSHVRSRIIHIQAHGYTKQEQTTYEETLEAIARLCSRGSRQEPNAINIIGFRCDLPHWRQDLHEICRILREQDVKINVVVPYSSFREIEENIGKASLNIVLGGDGILMARYLESELGIPYIVVPYPYGGQNMEILIEETCRELGKVPRLESLEREREQAIEVVRDSYTYLDGTYGALSCCMIGDQSRVLPMAETIESELGLPVELVVVRSRNPFYTQNSRFETLYEIDFNEFVNNVVRRDVDVIYGSTFERVLSSRYNKVLVRVFYPTFDEIVLTDRPLVGFRGLLTIFEKTLNEIMRCQERTEVRYFSNL